jgi:hypothetical protein
MYRTLRYQLSESTWWIGGIDLSTKSYRLLLKNGCYAIHEIYYDKEGES